MTIRSETTEANTECTLSVNTIVETLPNGPRDNLLFSLVSGTVDCNHPEPERFNGTGISLPGLGELIFQGTAFKAVFNPGKGAGMAVANGAVMFEFIEGADESGESPVMKRDQQLTINLESGTQQVSWNIGPAQFTSEDKRIFEAMGRTAEERYNAGLVDYEQGQLAAAIAEYDEAIILDPQLAAAYINRGLAYFDLGQHERAIRDYDEAIRLNPLNDLLALAYIDRGLAYADLEQQERAIQDDDEAIRLNPPNDLLALAYINRGLAYADLGQQERAIQDYDEAIRLTPPNDRLAQAYINRALAYADLGQQERAIQDNDEAIRLNPQHAPAYCNRSLAYTSLGRAAEAGQDADRALRLGTDCSR